MKENKHQKHNIRKTQGHCNALQFRLPAKYYNNFKHLVT